MTKPDGRQERFEYDATSSKLIRIFEDGVGGTPTRQWTYTWSGDDLHFISRPDGTTWEFRYDDPSHPGYLTRVDLLGTDGTSRRIEQTFEYDSVGNTTAMCRGEIACTGPSAVAPVDKMTFTYTNPTLPTQTVVTRFLTNGGTPVTMPVTYVIERDSRSIKARIKSISGECGSCGLTPNTTFEYNDAAQPLQPTAMVDGNSHRTEYAYNANGRMTSRIEAKATTEQRTTTWAYGSANFPAFATQTTSPSSDGVAGHLRSTTSTLNATTGNLETRTIDGFEGGAAFPSTIKDTTFVYNAAGQMVTTNPPGFGTTDVATFTYDPTRGNLVPLTRMNPVVGTTSFGYDGWNRRTRTTDPNLVITDTSYDLLNRVTQVDRRALGSGAPDMADLSTRYLYDCPAGTPADGSVPCRTFRDLRCVERPEGNGIEYRYDAAGRMIEMRRKADCAPATQALERTVYTLDVAGSRTLESLEVWDGAAWSAKSVTKSDFTKTCHVDKVTQGFGSASPSTKEYCYDNNGNLQQTWDANHPRASFPTASTSYGYDALDRLKTVTQVWGGSGGGTAVMSYAYDPQDHLLLVTDANNNLTSYETGDRDLMTEESSPVFSGATNFTSHAYDEHGNESQKTDPRGVTALLTHDPADRMTLIDWPGSDLDTTYTYDAPSVAFSKGRLTLISRTGSTIGYEYDRFGRATKDGALNTTYDENGNRRTIGYSPTVGLCYDYDDLDRPVGLKLTSSGGDPCLGSALVSSATYLPSGPLTSLALGNGLTETRLFDARYFPDRIQVPSRLDWDYTVDAVGNPTSVADGIVPFGNRTYGYQDYQYFLTSAAGPWASLGWSYDKIGNRLSETQISEPSPFTYTYLTNGTGGRTPKLTQIQPRPHGNGTGSIVYGFDPSGNQTTRQSTGQEGSGRTTTLAYSAESKLSGLAEAPGVASTSIQYDGRGFLRDSLLVYGGSGDFEHTEPTYSSEGLLFARRWRRTSTFGTPQDDGSTGTITGDETAHVFYFAGRPVAQLTIGASGPGSGLVYLTADHLGTPVLATSPAGATIWSGGFTPFGVPYQLMPPTLFLRLPGQWMDATWEGLGDRAYNVYRWYQPQSGTYTQVDAVRPSQSRVSYFDYARQNPLRYRDRLGLYSVDPSCSRCVNPLLVRDKRPLTSVFRSQLDTWCNTWVEKVPDVFLASCLAQSCNSGRVTCSKCDDPAWLGYTSFTTLQRILIPLGLMSPIRTARLCSNQVVLWEPWEAANTVIHEWSHGCGWTSDPCPSEGIPCGEE
ncbi:MAG TPA: RHS repeat-associated core domain-containing protein [Thermoanaerobaculia bacterium]|nr:RHS repeat-associated core domain-containing protein [Thermoanaerobaculia bacterium]